jgi:hypothetical protein
VSLLGLADAVQSHFRANEVPANVVFGRRERAKVINQGPGGANRVVICPGTPQGKMGRMGLDGLQPGARKDFGRARALAQWESIATVYVWAVDNAQRENEIAQYCAAVELLETTLQAIHTFAAGNYKLGDVDADATALERMYGFELSFTLFYQFPLLSTKPDRVIPIAHTETKSLLDERPAQGA